MASVVTINRRDALPDEAKATADLVERLGFSNWTYVHEYPLPDLSMRIQVRSEGNYVPASQVATYLAALRAGDKFPPVVMSKEGRLLDGNTRVEARRKGKFPTVPAIVLAEAYDTGGPSAQRRMHVLGAGFNARNGRGIDTNEITAAVLKIAEDDTYTSPRIAMLLGISEQTVFAIMREQAAREQAKRLGIKLNGDLPKVSLRALGSAKLHDEPFKAIVELAAEAGLKQADFTPILRSVKAAKSDDDALSVITTERVARAQQIADFTASAKARPPHASRLRMVMSQLPSDGRTAAEFVDRNDTSCEDYLVKLRAWTERLQEIIAAQVEFNAGRVKAKVG